MLKNGQFFIFPSNTMNKKSTMINLPELLLEYSPKAKFGIETINFNELKKRESLNNLDSVQRLKFLIFVMYTKGQGEHMVDFVHYPVAKGSLIVVQPGGVHQYLLNDSMQAEILIVNPSFISSEYLYSLQSFLPDYNWPCISHIKDDYLKEMLQICQLIKADEKRIGDYKLREALARQRLHTWLITMQLAWNEDNQFEKPSFDKPLMKDFLSLLEKKYIEHWSVKDYAQKLGYAERTLTRTCQEIKNKSAKLIIDQRMCLEIKRYLTNKNNTVTYVSLRLNFKDTSRMVQFFKRIEGITPAVFQTSIIEND